MAFTIDYTEEFTEVTSLTIDDVWNTKTLGADYYSKVTHVLIIASMDAADTYLGIRKYGSALDRRTYVHEQEGGGYGGFSIHVQVASSGRFEYYATTGATVKIYILGRYGTGVTYTEAADLINAQNIWTDRTLANAASCVHEFI